MEQDKTRAGETDVQKHPPSRSLTLSCQILSILSPHFLNCAAGIRLDKVDTMQQDEGDTGVGGRGEQKKLRGILCFYPV